jgi:hypothetical protein
MIEAGYTEKNTHTHSRALELSVSLSQKNTTHTRSTHGSTGLDSDAYKTRNHSHIQTLADFLLRHTLKYPSTLTYSFTHTQDLGIISASMPLRPPPLPQPPPPPPPLSKPPPPPPTTWFMASEV